MICKPPFPAECIRDKAIRINKYIRIIRKNILGRLDSFRVIRIDPSGHSDQLRGYTLLLAVVITSAVLSAATALAGIVISEIRQTREIVSAIKAYAQAESNTEKALFMLRKSDFALEDIQIDGVTLDTPNDPQYFSIAENDFVSLPVSFNSADNVEIPVWEITDGCASNSWIEVATISWGDSGFNTSRNQYSRAVDTPILISVNPNTVELRIKALYCDISSLGVSNMPGRVRIISTAEEGGAKQSIETSLSRGATVAGLFDFVIFSEEEIVK